MVSPDEQPNEQPGAIDLSPYAPLIERVARNEYRRLPSHLITYEEILSIAATAMYILLSTNPGKTYSTAYIATAIRWAIRNELKERYEWYSLQRSTDDGYPVDEQQSIREAIYETILTLEGLNEENPPDNSEERLELRELARSVRHAAMHLPTQTRQIFDARLIKGQKLRSIGEATNMTPLRILRLTRSGLDTIRDQLQKKEQQ